MTHETDIQAYHPSHFPILPFPLLLPFAQPFIHLIQHPRITLTCTRRPNSKSNVIQAREANVLTIDPYEYGRGSGECEVDKTIDEGHVCSELDDWFMVEEREGTEKTRFRLEVGVLG